MSHSAAPACLNVPPRRIGSKTWNMLFCRLLLWMELHSMCCITQMTNRCCFTFFFFFWRHIMYLFSQLKTVTRCLNRLSDSRITEQLQKWVSNFCKTENYFLGSDYNAKGGLPENDIFSVVVFFFQCFLGVN